MWLIISFSIILFTICILKDTHVKQYYRYIGEAKLIDEYDLVMPVWAALFIVLTSFIPFTNIVMFVGFIVYYTVHAYWDPNVCDYTTHVFSLKGKNFITRFLLSIKKLLNKEI